MILVNIIIEILKIKMVIPMVNVNYDGSLTQADASEILEFVGGDPYSHFQAYLADFNRDGVVTPADARALLLEIE